MYLNKQTKLMCMAGAFLLSTGFSLFSNYFFQHEKPAVYKRTRRKLFNNNEYQTEYSFLPIFSKNFVTEYFDDVLVEKYENGKYNQEIEMTKFKKKLKNFLIDKILEKQVDLGYTKKDIEGQIKYKFVRPKSVQIYIKWYYKNNPFIIWFDAFFINVER